MATTAASYPAILKKMRLMISEEGKGPLDGRLKASFCDWCVRRFPPEGLASLRGKPWPTNACPCHLVSYCGANCQASHWAAHSATCEQLRGADAESGEMPVLETGPADLPSIHLAAQVKRLTAEVKLQKEELAVGEHAFHGLMDLLVQSILNLASRNDALESHSIQLAAQIKRLTAEVKLQKEELAAATRHYAFHEDHQITAEDWTAFLEESQEMFNEECAEVSLRLWNEWSASQLP